MEDVVAIGVLVAGAGGIAWYAVVQWREIQRGSDRLVADRVASVGRILVTVPMAVTLNLGGMGAGDRVTVVVAGVLVVSMLAGAAAWWL